MTSAADWRPLASADTLRLRAKLLQTARQFFAARDVLEVQTPLTVGNTVSDPHTDALHVNNAIWLRTSPEYHLKRLLSAFQTDVFEIGAVFRAGESGRRHQPEFSMIEWYRLGLTASGMAEETCDLIDALLGAAGQPGRERAQTTYSEAFINAVDINPLSASTDEIRNATLEHVSGIPKDISNDRNTWLDMLAGHFVFPQQGRDKLQVITDYPADQAMLARLSEADSNVAERFEVFLDGIEIANGYWELTAADEQAQRFAADNEIRKQLGKPVVAPDPQLLAALESGLPDCAGVALGFDRLLMIAIGTDDIAATLSFLPGR